jgi:D-alanyl-D-alanine carboxypeptidase (penicillin-binding protein 5/6)
MFLTARRLLAAFSLAIAAIGLSPAAQAQVPYAQLSWGEPRYAAIVVDANSGEVLYSRNADSQRFPASITKIMTLYLTFEALASGRLRLNDTITISPHAARMAPTKLGLKAGETITVDDAMRAIAVKSANDMAVALAEKLGGDEERFAALMTLRAQELGMTNTRYVNASGLPDSRQISSARDIALLSRSVMRDFPQYYSYFGLHEFTFRGVTISNHNHLLDSMPGVDGLKTGFTNASGYNLAVSGVRNGHRLIAVVMGGNTWKARDNNAVELLQTGFTVMARRDRGENIQLAQNLFEPQEPTGPLMRPQFSQGDAEQRGLKIQLTNEVHPSPLAMRPIANPPEPIRVEAPAPVAPKAAEPKLVKVTELVPCKPAKAAPSKKGKKGKGAKPAKAATCERTRLVKASDVKPCKTVKDRHGKSRKVCESVTIADASDKDAAKLRGREKVDRKGGGWLVQVGAFKDKAQARKQLAKLNRSFSDELGDADPRVDGGGRGGLYRARFVGLSAKEARQACSAIKSRGHDCTAMSAG